MRVRVDREKCVSAENCVVTAPTVFVLDEDGKARLIDPSTVAEDDDGEQLYP
jgi:ferredoxin